MNLSDAIKIWDGIHIRDCGELCFCDLEKAIDKVVGIRNDIFLEQPQVSHKALGYAECPNCHQRVSITWRGNIKQHYLPFNGDHSPVCLATGLGHQVQEERGEKWWDKYHGRPYKEGGKK